MKLDKTGDRERSRAFHGGGCIHGFNPYLVCPYPTHVGRACQPESSSVIRQRGSFPQSSYYCSDSGSKGGVLFSVSARKIEISTSSCRPLRCLRMGKGGVHRLEIHSCCARPRAQFAWELLGARSSQLNPSIRKRLHASFSSRISGWRGIRADILSFRVFAVVS